MCLMVDFCRKHSHLFDVNRLIQLIKFSKTVNFFDLRFIVKNGCAFFSANKKT